MPQQLHAPSTAAPTQWGSRASSRSEDRVPLGGSVRVGMSRHASAHSAGHSAHRATLQGCTDLSQRWRRSGEGAREPPVKQSRRSGSSEEFATPRGAAAVARATSGSGAMPGVRKRLGKRLASVVDARLAIMRRATGRLPRRRAASMHDQKRTSKKPTRCAQRNAPRSRELSTPRGPDSTTRTSASQGGPKVGQRAIRNNLPPQNVHFVFPVHESPAQQQAPRNLIGERVQLHATPSYCTAPLVSSCSATPATAALDRRVAALRELALLELTPARRAAASRELDRVMRLHHVDSDCSHDDEPPSQLSDVLAHECETILFDTVYDNGSPIVHGCAIAPGENDRVDALYAHIQDNESYYNDNPDVRDHAWDQLAQDPHDDTFSATAGDDSASRATDTDRSRSASDYDQ